MTEFIGEGEESFINSAVDETVILLGLYGFPADKDEVYDHVVHHYLPECRW